MAIKGAIKGRVCAAGLNLFVAAAAVAGCAGLRSKDGDPSAIQPGHGPQDGAIEQRADVRAARQRWEAAVRRARAAELEPAAPRRTPAVPRLRAFGLDNLVRSGSDIGQAALAYLPPVLQGARPTPEARSAQAELKDAAAAYDRARRSASRETMVRTAAKASALVSGAAHRAAPGGTGNRR